MSLSHNRARVVLGVSGDEFGNWEKFTKENEMTDEKVTERSGYVGVLECGCFSQCG